MIDVNIQLLDGGRMPKQATEGAAGMDLFACIATKDSINALGLDKKEHSFSLADSHNYVVIAPGETKIVSAGIKVELPDGYEMQIRPRSGNSVKTKLRIANAPGTIDCDYRGAVGIIVDNIGDKPLVIFDGDRIAQAVIAETSKIKLNKVDSLSETSRGAGGFGSTGVK